jgi:hypothetical protein
MGTFYLLILMCLLALVCGAIIYTLRDMRPQHREELRQRLVHVWAWAHKNGQELVGIPAALVLFWVSGWVLRWIEPTSALYDAGVLQGATVVVVHLLIGNSLARFGCNLNIQWFGATDPKSSDRKWLFASYLAAYCLLAAVL